MEQALYVILKQLRGTRSQRSFAEAIGLDQTRVSRIEAGIIEPTADDIEKWCSGLNEEEAARFTAFYRTPWRASLRPHFDHPDLAVLAETACALERIENAPVDAGPLRSQLDRHQRTLESAAEALLTLKHRITFIGPKAVGKTTNMCIATNLLVPRADGRAASYQQAALETNTGGTTLATVSIETGSAWAIEVLPESVETIRVFVEELCAPFVPGYVKEDVPALSQEASLALRKMAGLYTPPRKKAVDPEVPDRLKELAGKTPENLVDEVMTRLDLPARTSTSFAPSPQDEPLSWLQRTFREINSGTRSDAPFPRTIRVLVPHRELPGGDGGVQGGGYTGTLFAGQYQLTLTDTRGVDPNNVLRRDILESLRDPRNLTVLCTLFEEVNPYLPQLIQDVTEKGDLEELKPRLCLLMLSKKGVAKETKIDGVAVDSQEEGYEVKRENVRTTFADMGIGDVHLDFFDASEDAPGCLINALRAGLERMRDVWRGRIRHQISASDAILANPEEAGRSAVITEALRRLGPELDPPMPSTRRPVGQRLVNKIDTAHARTVFAMVRRKGAWDSLDLEPHIQQGAAEDARLRWAEVAGKLITIIEHLKGDNLLASAHPFLEYMRDTLAATRSDFVTRAEELATSIFVYAMQGDAALWARCLGHWGRGFRPNVSQEMRIWMEGQRRLTLYEIQLEVAWAELVVKPVRDFCADVEDDLPPL